MLQQRHLIFRVSQFKRPCDEVIKAGCFFLVMNYASHVAMLFVHRYASLKIDTVV